MTDLITELKALGDPMCMTDFDCAFTLRNHLPTILAKLEEGERMREALGDMLRVHDWMVLAGGRKGPLPQDTIEKFAEMMVPAVDKARAALESTHDHT